MNEKMYCYILNRIRAINRDSGEEISIEFTLLNGEKIISTEFDLIGNGDILEVWDCEEIHFIPLKNILKISY